MFSYYGSKSKVISLYPSPKFGKVIEPFCGSARYALRYFDRDVLIMDKYEVVIKIWKYLQQASEKDIMGLPEPAIKESIENYNLSEGERLLMGFMVWRGTAKPQKIVQPDSNIHKAKKAIASQLFKIRHWEIRHGSYSEIENQEATWFIDPPYQVAYGEHYAGERIDYALLGEWCKSRKGQAIVCESVEATWLPFSKLRKTSGNWSSTTEGIWSNLSHDFLSSQLSLFTPSNTACSGLVESSAPQRESTLKKLSARRVLSQPATNR